MAFLTLNQHYLCTLKHNVVQLLQTDWTVQNSEYISKLVVVYRI